MYTVHTNTSSSYIYGATALIGLAGGIGTSKGCKSLPSVSEVHPTHTANIPTDSILPALLIRPSTHPSAHPRSPEPQYIPASIAFLNVAQIGSIVHALAISGSIFQNVAYSNLKAVFASNGLVFAEADVRAAVAGTKSVVFEGLQEDVRAQAIDAIVRAVGSVYSLAITSGALAVVVAVAMRWERLFQVPKPAVEVDVEGKGEEGKKEEVPGERAVHDAEEAQVEKEEK